MKKSRHTALSRGKNCYAIFCSETVMWFSVATSLFFLLRSSIFVFCHYRFIHFCGFAVCHYYCLSTSHPRLHNRQTKRKQSSMANRKNPVRAGSQTDCRPLLDSIIGFSETHKHTISIMLLWSRATHIAVSGSVHVALSHLFCLFEGTSGSHR